MLSDNMSDVLNTVDSDTIKSCCTSFYENDIIAMFFGENFHPGGEELTLYLGDKLDLNENSKVLDVACGAGVSALTLAQKFGCHVTGIDLSEKNLDKAEKKASDSGLSHKLEFVKSDAEKLQFDDESFDAVICECALCTFPDKQTAVKEMHRVLKKGGKLGITDVTIENELPDGLKNIVSRVICIAGALPSEGYQSLFRGKGFKEVIYEDQSDGIREIIERVDKLLPAWNIIKKLCDCDLEKIFGITSEEARDLITTGFEELEKGTFGYGLFTGIKD